MTLSVSHADFVLRPDSGRAITRLFVAGMEDVGPGHSRAPEVIERVMNLPEDAVIDAMADIDHRFAGRHRQLHEIFVRHAGLMRPGVDADATVSQARTLLL